VLIVEDDEQLAASTRVLLEKESLEIAVCHERKPTPAMPPAVGRDRLRHPRLDRLSPARGNLPKRRGFDAKRLKRFELSTFSMVIREVIGAKRLLI
jgi:hypothetical protein